MKTLGLWLLSLLGRLLYCGWKLLYVTGIKRAYVSALPVVSIGNLSVGGTGKTPVADWLLGRLVAWGYRPALLSRGYGRAASAERTLLLDASKPEGGPELYGDEPWLLHQHHPELLLAIDAQRDRAARLVENQADLLVLDDGFQHWRLHRDLDLVLVDAVAGLGNGQRLPLGPLREPLSALNRAQALLVTKCNWADPSALIERLEPYLAPDTPVFRLEYRPRGWVPLGGGEEEAAQELQGEPVWGFCGIGNPQGFEAALQEWGVELKGLSALKDHQAYDQDLIERLVEQARDAGATRLICTEKDAVKLRGLRLESVGYLAMELVVPEELEALIKTRLDALIRENR